MARQRKNKNKKEQAVKRGRNGKILKHSAPCNVCGKKTMWSCEFCDKPACMVCSESLIIGKKPTGGKWFGRKCKNCAEDDVPCPDTRQVYRSLEPDKFVKKEKNSEKSRPKTND